MKESQESKPVRKSWVKPLTIAFTFAAVGFYSTAFPHSGGVSATRLVIACSVGAVAGLLGYGVGTLIDRRRG
jgi:uncharacterized protein involved in response to NO